MNLRNHQITLGELLDYPPAKAVLQKRFPTLLKHPMVGAARTVTLEQLLAFGRNYLPELLIKQTLQELSKV